MEPLESIPEKEWWSVFAQVRWWDSPLYRLAQMKMELPRRMGRRRQTKEYYSTWRPNSIGQMTRYSAVNFQYVTIDNDYLVTLRSLTVWKLGVDLTHSLSWTMHMCSTGVPNKVCGFPFSSTREPHLNYHECECTMSLLKNHKFIYEKVPNRCRRLAFREWTRTPKAWFSCSCK